MSLSKEQIEFIRSFIGEQVKLPTLADDLADHLSCMTEEKMQDGKSFEESFRDSVVEFAPDGLRLIEMETIFLLNYKKRLFMKKLTFFVGTFFTMFMAVGGVMGLLHLPMGHMIFGLATFGFLIFFLPIDAIRYFRTSDENLKGKINYVLGMTSTTFLATGVLSRLMMLPGANEMIMLGLILFVVGFLPMQIVKMYQSAFSK